MNPTDTTRRPATIHECPNCETRYLNQRRCPDCNRPCRSIGTGRPRPHRDEPVTHTNMTVETTMPIT